MGAVPLNFLVERVPDHLIPGPCDSLMPCPPPAILVQRAPGGAQASESPKFPGISAAGVHGLRFEDAHTFCFTEERKETTCGKALLGPHGQSRGHPVWPPGLRFPTQHPTCCWAAASGNSAPPGLPCPHCHAGLGPQKPSPQLWRPKSKLGVPAGSRSPEKPRGRILCLLQLRAVAGSPLAPWLVQCGLLHWLVAFLLCVCLCFLLLQGHQAYWVRGPPHSSVTSL